DDFGSLETSIDGETVRTHIFFADPGASNQKPNVENYNAQARIAIPKKAVLDDCTQADLTELSCHLNSRLLNSLSDHTPYSLFAAAFGEETARKLGLRGIPPKEVRLKPIAK
ncbi:MAG: IS30 family transposase, partial [Bacilli bacterium]|nr:IS30 family transposase [Bacilli bacterium]